MVSLKDRCRFKKTLVLGLFCLGALIYLCMLARVNILNFKGSFVRQSRAHLVSLARAQARHIETVFERLDSRIEQGACRFLNNRESTLDPIDLLVQEIGLPIEAFVVCDAQGDLIAGQGESAAGASLTSAFLDTLRFKPIQQGAAVRLDRSDPERVWVISTVHDGNAFTGYAAAVFRWDDLLQDLRIAGVTSESSLLFADPEQRRSASARVPSADGILARAARGFEGTAELGAAPADVPSFEGNLVAGYCPAFLFNESWPVAVIADDAQLQASVKAHAEGIFVAMICLFLVLLVICGSFYLSERGRLILEQQTQLSSTTTELHMVAAEKRRLTEQFKHELSFLRQVLNALPFGLYWKDENGQILGQNPALGALLEQSDDPSEAMNAINDQALDHEVRVKGVPLMHVPQTLHTAGGQAQQILVSRIPLRGPNGRITGTLNCQLPADCFKNLHSGCVCDFLDDECIADMWTVPMLLVGSDQQVLYANPAFAAWSGIAHEQIHSASFDTLLDLAGPSLTRIARADAAGEWMPLTVSGKAMQAFIQPLSIGHRDATLVLLADLGGAALRPASEQSSAGQTRSAQANGAQMAVSEKDRPDILVVDDVEENRILLEMLLDKEGCIVKGCSCGQDAVNLCRQKRFDLVLMDIQMPGMDGFETLRQIRLIELNFATPVIAMTASERREDETVAIECGFDDYLSKPINQKIVRQKIWRALQKVKQAHDAGAGRDIISFLDGNPDYGKAIETFVQNLPGRLDEMKEAFACRDFQALAFKVHALKGVGGFAGFSIYTEKARQMEDAIRQQQMDDIARQLDELMDMCLRTRLKSDCS